jgi:hypothetical protein
MAYLVRSLLIMLARRSMALRFLIVLAIACCVSGAAKPGKLKLPRTPAKPVIYGTYVVECRGYYRGTLTASVNPAVITITGEVTGEDGKKHTIVAACALLGYRFNGVATASLGVIELTGRIDPPSPPNDIIPRPRLNCTWTTLGGHTGRMVGLQK